MSPFFRKLKIHSKVAPGIERKILRQIPQVFIFGLLGLSLSSLLTRLFPIAGSVAEVQRWIGTVDIYVISLIVFYCTAIFTIGLGALIVMIMKGPAYVADAYPLIDFDKPYSGEKKEGWSMHAIIERPENGATAKQIISKVSQEVLLPAEHIEGHYCDNRFPSRKPIDRYSCVELIRYIWINQSSRRAFVVKLPKDLPTDNAFIQGFDDQYLGYVHQKLGRAHLKDLAVLHKKINDIEKYKRQLGTGIFALMGTAGMSAFSKRELSSLLSEQAKSLRPVYAMIDERLEALKSELASKKGIFQRGSTNGYYDRRAA